MSYSIFGTKSSDKDIFQWSNSTLPNVYMVHSTLEGHWADIFIWCKIIWLSRKAWLLITIFTSSFSFYLPSFLGGKRKVGAFLLDQIIWVLMGLNLRLTLLNLRKIRGYPKMRRKLYALNVKNALYNAKKNYFLIYLFSLAKSLFMCLITRIS